MTYAIIILPLAPVRKLPSHRQEMVNQLLFGEGVKVIENKNGEWYKVQSLYDGYTGWVTWHMLKEVNKKTATQKVGALAGELLNQICINNQNMYLPMGAFLIDYPDLSYTFKGKKLYPFSKTSSKAILIESYARQWLNAPYLWGGKSIYGVDCSGFVQTIFKLAGVRLLRDASQQVKQGRLVKTLKNARQGDLAFFHDKEEIIHVGILLSPRQIIHAAGKVRIDTIDEIGITNVDTGKRTHQLKTIKRIL